MSNYLTDKDSTCFPEESKDLNSFLIGKMDFIEEGFLKEEGYKSSMNSELESGALNFLERLKQPKSIKKTTQQASTEGVFISTGFKRTRKQIAKVIDIQAEIVVLEFIVNKDLGKFKTKKFAPNLFSDVNLTIDKYLIFNHFRRGNTFKIEISDNQNLISKEELPDYNFDEFSNLFS